MSTVTEHAGITVGRATCYLAEFLEPATKNKNGILRRTDPGKEDSPPDGIGRTRRKMYTS